MDMGDELGQVREGYLADMLLVDGDPLADVSILQRQERLVAIMQNGNFHKLDRDALARPSLNLFVKPWRRTPHSCSGAGLNQILRRVYKIFM